MITAQKPVPKFLQKRLSPQQIVWLSKHGKIAFWLTITFFIVKGTITTAFILGPALYFWLHN